MRVCHNKKRSADLVICANTQTTSADHVTACAVWLATVVNTAVPVPSSGHPHSVVVGTWHSDHVPQGSTQVHNTLVAVVHADGFVFAPDCINDLLVDESAFLMPRLDAATVASALKGQPRPFVSAVGVSAVSEQFAAEVWGEIVAIDRQWMDGAGGGFGRHPSWQWDAADKAWDCRERSAEYGWH